ncbi:MAG: 6-hydroxymethylpterin diphosphokinase MptE-like protein [Alphaproteobacteria bacterium]
MTQNKGTKRRFRCVRIQGQIAMEIDTAPEVEEGKQTFTERFWIVPKTEEERNALRKRNLSLFEKKYNSVYQTFLKFEPKSELVFDEDGQPDIAFANSTFYDGDIEGSVTRQLATYWRNPNRLNLNPPTPETMDTLAGKFVHAMIRRLTEELGAEFTVGRTNPHSFYGMIMGIGLGRHIPEFIERTGCRNLFILDPNLEGFHHSLSLLDWSGLMMEMQDRNGDIFFYIGGTPQSWMDGLRFQTRSSNTVSLDGFYIYNHFQNSMFAEFSKKFNKESQFLVTGLGFFYDEQLMIRNTYSNMMGRNSRIYLREESTAPQKIPVIIVGCGPSLDDNIEEIKRNADNAVIMSCGSALGPLMDVGITPDFQLELENFRVLPVLMYAASKYDLSDICLVASSTVDREITDYFKDIVYWFRPALAPYPIFSNNMQNCLRHPDPTVVNVGLTFAQELGFREYYFFGTDMGQKGNNKHHSKSSFHYSEEAKNEAIQTFNIEIPANFGGKARTSSGLFWALDTLQRAIGYSPNDYKYFNCSDGARINRAIPKLARTLDLPKPEVSRADAVRNIVESFPTMTDAEVDACWEPEKMIEAMNNLLDDLVDIVETCDLIKTTDHLIEASNRFYGAKDDHLEAFAGLLLRGTINQMFIGTDYFLCRINNEDLYEDALEVVREEFRKTTDQLREIGTKNIRAQAFGIELPNTYLSGEFDDDELTDAQRESLTVPQHKPAQKTEEEKMSGANTD